MIALTMVGGCASGARDASSSPASVSASALPSVELPTRPGVVVPPVGARFDYQIGGPYSPADGVGIVERDHSVTPAAGVYNICYVNAFQTQPEQLTFWTANHPEVLLTRDGSHVEDPDWPGEIVLDSSTEAKRSVIVTVIAAWMGDCARAGYRAVELDNLDSWTRSHGLLTQDDNVALATALAAAAHGLRLAVAQKNTPQMGATGRDQIGFDFAVAEECQVYDECGAYTDVYGRHVIEIEYSDQAPRFFATACRERGQAISLIRRDRTVKPRGSAGYHDESCPA